jgi:N-formylglutamate deformylase
MEELFRLRPGSSPLLVSMPHVGTHVPEPMLARLTPAAQALCDTDWHLERLYDFLEAIEASVLVATHSRYVIDLNRPPRNENLWGANS